MSDWIQDQAEFEAALDKAFVHYQSEMKTMWGPPNTMSYTAGEVQVPLHELIRRKGVEVDPIFRQYGLGLRWKNTTRDFEVHRIPEVPSTPERDRIPVPGVDYDFDPEYDALPRCDHEELPAWTYCAWATIIVIVMVVGGGLYFWGFA